MHLKMNNNYDQKGKVTGIVFRCRKILLTIFGVKITIVIQIGNLEM